MPKGLARRSVLVTGGGGLIGSILVRALLAKECKVRVLDIRYGDLDAIKTNPNLQFAGIEDDPLRGGMANKKLVISAVRGVDIVYHLAINWNGSTWRHEVPLADLYDSNIRGTLNLLEAATTQRVKHFLFASSAAVYGETLRTLSLNRRLGGSSLSNEESACKPESWEGDPGPAYAILKLTTEKLCLMFARLYGLPVTVFRIEYAFAGRKELEDYANIHVDDVLRAFLDATMNKRAYGHVFNLADPAPHISVKKIQRMLGWKPSSTKQFLKTNRDSRSPHLTVRRVH